MCDVVFEWAVDDVECIKFFEDEAFDEEGGDVGFNGHDEVEWFEHDFLV